MKAFEDLQGISAYLEGESGLMTANRVCRSIYDAAQQLRRFPQIGRQGLETGTREWVVPAVSAYIVVYRLVGTEAVEILRIWHGAQMR